MSDGSARAAPSRQDRFVTDECHLLHPRDTVNSRRAVDAMWHEFILHTQAYRD